MKRELLEFLRCPISGQTLNLRAESEFGEEIETGHLSTEDGRNSYAVSRGIPRFVDGPSYADNFGLQWNNFRRTQLDSHSHTTISSDRFWRSTGWAPEKLAGQWVLDIGCGAGRFAEIALTAGAKVIALDYSNAVDACRDNLRGFPNCHVVQGSIYNLPLRRHSFPYVYSLGVLQHTPDVGAAFFSLPPMLREDGHLCVDVYMKSWRTAVNPRYWIRPITTRMSEEKLLRYVKRAVPVLLPLSERLRVIPLVGSTLHRLIPIANCNGRLPLTAAQGLEWSVLDTFDMLAPTYDQPQTKNTLKIWFENARFDNVEIFLAGHLVARGRKPKCA